MTDKEFRRLGKTEMLEIIHSQELEIQELRGQIQSLQSQLDERSILISESGSIAEASLKINQVFQAAQAAADQYLANIKANALHENPASKHSRGRKKRRKPTAEETAAE